MRLHRPFSYRPAFEHLEARSLPAVALVAGNLALDGSNGNNNIAISRVNAAGTDYLRVRDSANPISAGSGANQIDANTVDVIWSSITGSMTVNTLGGNDTLTVDLSTGDVIPAGGIFYNGGDPTTAPGDSLIITGGSQGTATYNSTNAHDGSVVMSNFGTINYTGLEPISNSGTVADVIFNLPAGGSDAVLEDDGILGNGLSHLRSGTASFETTTFVNPSNSLTINRGNAADTVTINYAPDFNQSLTAGSLGAPFTSISAAGALTLASGANLSLAAQTITAGGALVTNGGSITLNATNGITLANALSTAGGAMNVNADSDADGTGILTINAPLAELVDPHPAAGNKFGDNIAVLPNGNVVVTSPYDDAGGTDAGAVYLFNGATGALISTLRGSSANDNVGNGSITVLTNGNYVVTSPSWDNGAATDAGAVTWGSGTSGVSGVVSSANSLVGSTANDLVGGSGVTALTNGNYVVKSPVWDNAPATDAGAVTWGSGTSGVSGVVSSANSLVGSMATDQIGSGGITALTSGNYVVGSPLWDNGSATDAGAVSWGSGTSGVFGVVSSANSLVGSMANDQIGYGGITLLTNGNYVVDSPLWDNGAATDAGAVTWGSGTSGVSGVVSSFNSLVGSTAADQIGFQADSPSVTALTNGNYVVSSYRWHNGAVAFAGAVTWGSGTAGVSGVVSSVNSLVGSSYGDSVGWGAAGYPGVTGLPSGNYVVHSFEWANFTGAVTWGSGTTGISGVISSANSLVGGRAGDAIGIGGIVTLSNGNYVVRSYNWTNGTAYGAGAVTWASGTSMVSGVVSSANSLVGSTANDQVGFVTPLSNGNYVVTSFFWDNGAATDAGAATWGSGTSGVSGVISSANSLVGSTANDQIGSDPAIALSNGNYVVRSVVWDNGAATDAGAVTWGSGTSGVVGVVSSANSLVGSTANDNVGARSVTALTNGNYVVDSPYWGNGAMTNAGAVTWGSGTSGVSGVVSSANSLVGSTAGDYVGYYGVTELSSGNYVVDSPYWDNGSAKDAGAVIWGSGTLGISGVISSANSVIGSKAKDQIGIGGVTALTSGNYVVDSPYWDNGAATDAGAVTWGSGTSGVSGVISSANSLVGSTASDQIGNGGVTALTSGNYVVNSPLWDNGPAADAGAVTWGSGTSGVLGVVSSSNSLVGNSANSGLMLTIDNTTGRFFARFTTDGTGRVLSGTQVKGTYGLDAGAGSVSLQAGNGNGVAPILAGVDVKAASTSFVSGSDLTVSIQGTIVDRQYTQLRVSGPVNLAGVDLSLTGSYVPVLGDVFTIVSAPSIAGTFNGHPNGSLYAFNGVLMKISYTATAVSLAYISSTVAPTITQITPTIGPTLGGTLVTITGTHFNGATSITIGGMVASGFTVNSDTQITATTPAGSPGVADVIVTTPGGSSANTAADDFTYSNPPTLVSTVLNGDDQELLNLPSQFVSQRSMVRSFQLTFDSAVELDPGAVVIALHPGSNIIGIVPTITLTPMTVGATFDTVWNVTFSGAGVTGGSIADGQYDLTVDPAKVKNGYGQVLAAAPVPVTFYRLFGDSGGIGTVSNANIIDVRRAANTTSAMNGFFWLFDSDWDGSVSTVDVIAVRRNTNKSI